MFQHPHGNFSLFWRVIFQREASFGSLFVTVWNAREDEEGCSLDLHFRWGECVCILHNHSNSEGWRHAVPVKILLVSCWTTTWYELPSPRVGYNEFDFFKKKNKPKKKTDPVTGVKLNSKIKFTKYLLVLILEPFRAHLAKKLQQLLI